MLLRAYSININRLYSQVKLYSVVYYIASCCSLLSYVKLALNAGGIYCLLKPQLYPTLSTQQKMSHVLFFGNECNQAKTGRQIDLSVIRDNCYQTDSFC